MFARKQFPAPLLFLALSIATLYLHTAAAQDRQGTPVTSLARVREAVVHIVSVGAAWGYDESEPSVEVGAGSGFMVNPEGIVVTNTHVVNDRSGFLPSRIRRRLPGRGVHGDQGARTSCE